VNFGVAALARGAAALVVERLNQRVRYVKALERSAFCVWARSETRLSAGMGLLPAPAKIIPDF